MQKSLFVLFFTLTSLGAMAQSNTEVRGASKLGGGVNYVGVRTNKELVSEAEVFAFNVGLEASMLLQKANFGPSAGVRLLPNDLVSLNASVQRNVLLGETNFDYGADIRINNSNTRLGIGKIENERGSTTYVGVRIPSGGRRQ
jgi:hypothetical protein